MNTYLFLFTISPVQSFISQARKTADLYASSRLLSDLCRIGALEFVKHNGQVIFPKVDNESIPNRFIGKIVVKEDRLNDLGQAVEKAVWDEIKRIGENILKDLKINSVPNNFFVQLTDYFYIDWIFLPHEKEYVKDYSKIEKALGAIKNLRLFHQNEEIGRKCSLSGEQNALFYRGKKPYFIQKDAVEIKGTNSFYLKNGEGLSAVGLMKRFYKKNESYPSTAQIALMDTLYTLRKKINNLNTLYKVEMLITFDKSTGGDHQLLYPENLNEKYFIKNGLKKASKKLPDYKEGLKKLYEIAKEHNLKFSKYYAIIAFDGDSMGNWLSGTYINENDLEEFHKHLTKQLAIFANKVQKKIIEPKGSVVYAGGEDFLGFINLNHLFEVLKELYQDFTNIDLTNFTNKRLTFSAGIVIAHYKTPLSEVLNWARKMEKEAKEIDTDKNAFSIAVLKRSGEIQKCRYHWMNRENEYLTDILADILKGIMSNVISTSFIKNFEKEFSRLGESFYVNKNIMRAEIDRLIKRSFKGNKEQEEILNSFQTNVKKLLKDGNNFQNFLFSLYIIEFISRELNYVN